jgi:uncharacterized protein YegL
MISSTGELKRICSPKLVQNHHLRRVFCTRNATNKLFFRCVILTLIYPEISGGKLKQKGDDNLKKDLTELIFILDRSGSMSGLEEDTIGGFNSLMEKQKNEPGEANVTTVLFDNKYELLHDRIDLKDVNPITSKEYYVRGMTALLDAIGFTIEKIKNAQNSLAKEERAENVMFIITTDGLENASREYNSDRIKAMIEEQKEKSGWEFLFIGANIDAVEIASRYGISSDSAVNYSHDSYGVEAKYRAMEKAVYSVRRSEHLGASWKEELEKSSKKGDKKGDKTNKPKKKGILSRLRKAAGKNRKPHDFIGHLIQ